ncbi:hypothetical protein GALL_535400 [mine drainage metagenome]|uniref:Uncharacterized protein n=1 Tax=mine drainage metagenome TaxID=410659 RepID=A0A1J5PI03_9ZZZZ
MVESASSRTQEADSREVDAACDRWQQQSGRRRKPCPMTVLAGGFNRSMQHTKNCVCRRSVADEAASPDLLLGDPEGPDVGAVEGRLDAAQNCPAVRSRSLVHTENFCRVRWHPSATAAPIAAGVDARRTRRDLACIGRRPLDSFNRCANRTSTIDNQSRDQPQWWARRLPRESSRQRSLGEGASPQALQAG